MYLDITNLYGYAMIQKLPISDFEEILIEDFKDDILNIDDSKYGILFLINFAFAKLVGYIFEVDLEYPLDLHDKHIDLPFAPEHVNNKLIPNLNDKKNYKIHYKHLQICLENGIFIFKSIAFAMQIGLKIIKIHKIIRFLHSEWLKPFIELNTEIRKNTNNKSEKDLAKLMNNSIFGKSMENILGIYYFLFQISMVYKSFA